jgi:hypothetical protein
MTMKSAERKPRKRAKRGDESQELRLEAFLAHRKVSELQEMWGFWQNGRRPPTRKGELLEPLLDALRDEETVRSRIKILSDRPREVLVRLVRREGYSGRLPDLVEAANGRGLETYEVEAAARALSRRGFLRVSRDRAAGRRGGERYVIPVDLGDLITALLQEDRRGPREIFSLRGHIASTTPPQRRKLLEFAHGAADATDEGATGEEVAAALVNGRTAVDLLSRMEDEALRDALAPLAARYGGIVLRERLEEALGPDWRWDRVRVQTELEGAGLGTVTTLALEDYGIDLGGESVVLFAEVVEAVLDSLRPVDESACDRVDTARVDLLTDLQQLLNLVASTPLRVTQGRTIYRAAQHRILEAFIFNEDGLMDREGIFGLVYSLAFGLELVEVTDESRLRLTKKGEAWDSIELTDKVRAIYGRFLEERLPEGRDFHVRRLRRAVAAALASTEAGTFLPLNDAPFRVRNDYLAALEEAGVAELYRNRVRYTYKPPQESPEELLDDLVEYIVKRLYPLGVVDVALADDEPVALRLTDLGRRLIQGERLCGETDLAAPAEPAAPVRPLVVNPDFEVLLFPEGDVNEVAHTLSRFAARTKSEEVSHYRIGREAVERAVVKGMDADEILDFLESYARVPVPQNVSYSIREWGARVSFARQIEGVVLTTSNPEALDRILSESEVKRLLIRRLGPQAAVLRARITDWKVLETLRDVGVYFR